LAPLNEKICTCNSRRYAKGVRSKGQRGNVGFYRIFVKKENADKLGLASPGL